jgi:hypothetical protein
MTTITLPPDLEARLAEEARRSGATPEQLALDGLRRLFAPPVVEANGSSLFDFLAGHIGTVAGSTEPLSEDCGRRFADGMLEKHLRERP